MIKASRVRINLFNTNTFKQQLRMLTTIVTCDTEISIKVLCYIIRPNLSHKKSRKVGLYKKVHLPEELSSSLLSSVLCC